MDPIRIAVVGAGGVANTHVLHWLRQPGVEIVAVADASPERARALAERHGLPASVVCASLPEALSRPADAVDLCTPPWLHEPQALEALAAGRHVILEKPLAGSLAGFERLLAAEAAAGRRVVPVLQNRLGIGPRQLRAVQRAGLAGRFLHGTIETGWRRGREYYDGTWHGRYATELGGCLAGLAIHQLDLVLGFLPPVVSAVAHAATMVHPIEVEDTGAGLLSLAGGGWLAVTASVHQHAQYSRGMLVFADCQVEFGPDPYGYAEAPWRFTSADPARHAAIQAAIAAETPEPTPEGCYQLWIAAARVWASAVRGPVAEDLVARCPVDLASARAGLEAMTAIYAAARTRGRIDLPMTAAQPHFHRMAP
ncbi:MAG: hypothetical protein RLZZ127_482 [Planctomycetota bacterium]|jgi:predicted dehydrogenase